MRKKKEMLNEKLFQALQKAFGPAEVVNEGVQAEITLEAVPGRWHLNPNGEHGEQYRVRCPFCGDRDRHLYVSYLSYACPVKDGDKLQQGRLTAQCFRRGCLKDPDNRNSFESRLGIAFAAVNNGEFTPASVNMDSGETVESHYSTSCQATLEGIRTWVPDFSFISDTTDSEVLEYLRGRRVTDADIKWLRIGSGPVESPRTHRVLNDGKPWVIFPVIQNGKLVGVQARCPDIYLKEDGIRYWFHPGMRKRTVLFNMDEARKFGFAVVNEGVFDVLSVGRPGVCTFGCTPSTVQLNLLKTFDKGLVWLPDTEGKSVRDPYDEAVKLAAEWNGLNLFPLGVHVVRLPAKDAGSMTRKALWETILAQVTGEMADFIRKSGAVLE